MVSPELVRELRMVSPELDEPRWTQEIWPSSLLIRLCWQTYGMRSLPIFLGSSVLKCEAWDFSVFCRSQSFC